MGAHDVLHDGDRYELLGELAAGGMATVYLARMRRPMGFSRLVAIKCMHPQFAKDPSFVSMFMDEARLTARLRHPNIVPTLDIVADAGHLLLVMEYVEGASLAHLLRAANRAGTTIPVPIACAIVHDLLLGLHEAHEARDDEGAPLAIVHRDVSPQNVLVGLDGLARVLDFGVAKARQNTHLSNDNEIKGKIPYMPPEQLFGEALDHKVDVYAAGVTLWEALVCQRLFDGPSETALVRKISEDPIAPPSSRTPAVPPAIDAVVMKALARDPSARHESALAMAQALAAVVALPTRTEVSAWVRQHVAPREIPSGGKLPAVSVVLSQPALPARVEDVVTEAATVIAVLEKASALRPSAKRPPAMRPGRRARLALGLGACAIALAAIGVVRNARSATPSRPVALAPPPVALVPPPPPAASTVPAPTVAVPEKKEPPKPAPRVVKAAPAPRAAPSAAAEPEPAKTEKPKDCRIPFTIDENGHKHYRVECIP